MGSDYLGAVAPVCLIAIVFLGVVRGCDVHAALTTQFTDCERKLGSGTEIFEEIHLDAVGREDVGYDFGEFAGVVTHVMAYNHADLGHVGKSLVKIVGKTLCGCAHGIDVHAVRAGTHYAAEAACTEFVVLIERFDEFGFVFGVEHATHFGFGFGIVAGIVEPALSLGCHLREKFVICHVYISYVVN